MTPKRSCAPPGARRKPVMTSSKIKDRAVARAGLARAFEIARCGMDRAGIAHGGFHDDAATSPLARRSSRRSRSFQTSTSIPSAASGSCPALPATGIGALLRPGRVEPRAQSTTGCCRTSRDNGLRTSGSSGGRSRRARGASRPARPPSPRSRSACARRRARTRRRGAPPRPRARPGRRTGCPIDLIPDRLTQRLRAVAEDHRAHAEIVVDQPVAIDVEEVGPLGALEHERRRRDVEAEVAVDAAGNPAGILA